LTKINRTKFLFNVYSMTTRYEKRMGRKVYLLFMTGYK
jgi:hypothetical protein